MLGKNLFLSLFVGMLLLGGCGDDGGDGNGNGRIDASAAAIDAGTGGSDGSTQTGDGGADPAADGGASSDGGALDPIRAEVRGR